MSVKKEDYKRNSFGEESESSDGQW